MKSDIIYNFIGCVVVVIFFIYIVSKMMKLQINVMEKFTNITDGKDAPVSSFNQPADIKTIITNLKLSENNIKNAIDLSTNEKKENYKDVLFHSYNIVNYNLIQLIVNSSADISNMLQNNDVIKRINDTKILMDTIDLAYKSIDKL